MSGSYEHVTDRRERRTHTDAPTHINTHAHSHAKDTREGERQKNRMREREREREREEWIEKGQLGVTTIQTWATCNRYTAQMLTLRCQHVGDMHAQ